MSSAFKMTGEPPTDAKKHLKVVRTPEDFYIPLPGIIQLSITSFYRWIKQKFHHS
jgi:hypothetical protein